MKYDAADDSRKSYDLAIAEQRKAHLLSKAVQIGDATLYCGDCLEYLPLLGKVDAVVTDPPYGLGKKWQGGKSKWPLAHNGDGYASIQQWDGKRPSGKVWAMMGDVPKIIWGGNHFADQLPPSSGWLVWDKIVRNFTSGHCELAWTNIDQPIRTFTYSHGQLANESKVHPTQKPLPLMEWCLGFLPNAETILDPFAGSGTTGVACAKMGRKFIGIEKEQQYFDIACKRIEEAYAQPDLFLEPPAKAVQESLI